MLYRGAVEIAVGKVPQQIAIRRNVEFLAQQFGP